MQGAQFTVRYYDTTDPKSLSKDYATRTAAAKKTWVYETNEYGVISVNNQTPISGDEVYKDGNGDTTLPVGTYIVEETLAPTGYLLPTCQDRTFIGVVTGTGTYGIAGNVYKPIGNDEITLSNGTKITLTGLGWTKW